MEKSNIVLNTLVFDQQHQEGLSQADMLNKITSFDLSTAEVRREYFTNIADETIAIAEQNKKLGLKLFYSVPETIFTKDGLLNPDLPKYFKEAETMGISSLKMNIGNFEAYSGNLASDLKPYSDAKIEFNIENDQTELNGTINNISTFLNAVKQANIDIKFVFDLGNWRYVGQSENDAATKLHDFVRYIHVKNVLIDNNNKYAVVPLDKGVINWQETLRLLPSSLPIALEYPATDNEIRSGIQLLTSFN